MSTNIRKRAFEAAVAEIETDADLQTFLETLLERKGIDGSVEVEGDNASLRVSFEDVGINDDSVITNPIKTFSVTVTVTLSQTFEVESTSRDEVERSFEHGGDNFDKVEFDWAWSQDDFDLDISEW